MGVYNSSSTLSVSLQHTNTIASRIPSHPPRPPLVYCLSLNNIFNNQPTSQFTPHQIHHLSHSLRLHFSSCHNPFSYSSRSLHTKSCLVSFYFIFFPFSLHTAHKCTHLSAPPGSSVHTPVINGSAMAHFMTSTSFTVHTHTSNPRCLASCNNLRPALVAAADQ